MSQADPVTADVPPSETPSSTTSLFLDDVHVTYRVYEDVRPTLRRFVTSRFRPRNYTPVPAVRGVTLKLNRGDVLGVVGANGSGKSTLLRAMAGLLPPTRGAVYASSPPVLLTVGAALRGDLSGRRNVYLGGSALGMSKAELDARFDEIVEFAGVGHAIDRPLRTYSSGMSARLQFSIAAAVEPEILLIDEALAVGDDAFRKKSGERVAQMREAAGTVVIVSHGKGLERMCNRAIWMSDGELVAEGDPDEVIGAYRQSYET